MCFFSPVWNHGQEMVTETSSWSPHRCQVWNILIQIMCLHLLFTLIPALSLRIWTSWRCKGFQVVNPSQLWAFQQIPCIVSGSTGSALVDLLQVWLNNLLLNLLHFWIVNSKKILKMLNIFNYIFLRKCSPPIYSGDSRIVLHILCWWCWIIISVCTIINQYWNVLHVDTQYQLD